MSAGSVLMTTPPGTGLKPSIALGSSLTPVADSWAFTSVLVDLRVLYVEHWLPSLLCTCDRLPFSLAACRVRQPRWPSVCCTSSCPSFSFLMATLLHSDTFESLRPSWQVSPLANALGSAPLLRLRNWTLLSEGLDWDFSLFGTLLLFTRPCFEHEVVRARDKVCLD